MRSAVGVGLVHCDDGIEENLEIGARFGRGVGGYGGCEVAAGR